MQVSQLLFYGGIVGILISISLTIVQFVSMHRRKKLSKASETVVHTVTPMKVERINIAFTQDFHDGETERVR